MFVVEIMGIKTTRNNKLRVVEGRGVLEFNTTMYCNDNN